MGMAREGMSDRVTLRPANLDDVALLRRWDREPHVIAATTDEADAQVAHETDDWSYELALQSEAYAYFIAERDGRPIGAMQVIDPHAEPTHYWGEIAPNLRAVDIWIGEVGDLGRGYGEQMMRQMLQRCFATPEVTAVLIDPLTSNIRAHKFYQRLGFVPQGRRTFNAGEDDCLVHELSRAQWRKQFPGD